MAETIELLGETIPVVPQPWNRLASGLSKYKDKLTPDAEVTVSRLGTEAYEVLCVLAPEVRSRIPEYRWLGFASREALDASESDFGDDEGPTIPEVVQAFKTALKVNGADAFSALGKLVDPRMLQALISGAIEDAARTYSSTSHSQSGTPVLTNGSASSPPSESLSAAGLSRESGGPGPAGD